MILNMIVSTGSTDAAVVTKSIIFYGAPSEVLTLYGDTNLTIPLDNTGKAVVDIPTGSYLIMGTLSQKCMPKGKQITINDSTTSINSYPEKAIYWFGNGHLSGSPLLDTYGEYKTTGWILHPDNPNRDYTDFGDTYVRSKVYSNGSTEYRALTTNTNLIDFTGYKTINFYGSHPYRADPHYKLSSNNVDWYIDYYAGNRGYFGISIDKQTLAVQDGNAEIIEGKVSIEIPSNITSGYVGILATSQGVGGNDYCHTDMYACWLE